MIRSLPLSIAAALLAFGLSVPALAATDAAIHVSYADLDLSSSSGQATLYHRLRRAADSLCFVGKVRDLGQIAACRDDVLAGVRPAVQVAVDAARDHRFAESSIAVRTLR